MRHTALCLIPIVVSACAMIPTPFVAPAAAGKSAAEVSRLVPASEARLFPCAITEVKDANGADLGYGSNWKSDVTLPAGAYRVSLVCSSGQHEFRPQIGVNARAGKTYRLTGYPLDDSITIFNMKMGIKVAELP